MSKEPTFRVSVITPVYNASEFVTRSVESALAQPETGEVLLIEDNSPDDSLRVCQELAAKYDKVRLLRHPDGVNHGAGASRNLGMQNARFEYIGYVDADNFYLPNRFELTKVVFQANPDCEGVYEAIGIHVENAAALERWTKDKRQPVDSLVTLQRAVEPETLGKTLINGSLGSLTLDGFVIKRNVLEKSGFMAVNLRLHQDTEFIIRCALVSQLYAGNLANPVAMEGVHERNRFSAPKSQKQIFENRMAYWMSLYHWTMENSPPETQQEVRKAIVNFVRAHKYFRNFPRKYFPTRVIWMTRYLRLLRYPRLLLVTLQDQWSQEKKLS